MKPACKQKKPQGDRKNKKLVLAAIVVTVFCWIIAFRGFLSGVLQFRHDAHPYYEHCKFFIDSMLRGVFPLWDPTWNCGVPNEFFLRRMGDFNPFYSLIVLLRLVGFPHLIAYNIFLVAYFFLGMVGFYCLCRKVFKSTSVALLGFFLLSFSSVSTLCFSSYTYLIFTPLVWCFFFIISFHLKQTRASFFGVFFTLMLLSSTYIPFYFILIFIVFFLVFMFVFPKQLVLFLKNMSRFIKGNKLLVLFCIVALLFSMIPGWLMFKEAGSGQFVLPTRNFNATISNAIGVPEQRSEFGGVLPQYIAKEVFGGVTNMTLSRVYLPFLAFIVLLLGVGTAMSPRLILFVGVGGFLFIMGIYDAPIYKALYKYVFFFKYLRNFQFFFWVATLPLFIMICCDHFSSFKKCIFDDKRRWFILSWIILVHICFGVVMAFLNLLSVMFVALLSVSCLYFILLLIFKARIKKPLMVFILGAMVIIPSFEVYHYLGQNAKKRTLVYRYEGDYQKFQYRRLDDENPIFVDKRLDVIEKSTILKQNKNLNERFIIYYGTKWYNQLLQNINQVVFRNYIRNRFIAYDAVAWVDTKDMPWAQIEMSLATFENKAFVESTNRLVDVSFMTNKNPSRKARVLESNSDVFKVESFGVNSIRLKTNFTQKKFLVYTDSFYPGWRVFINGERDQIFRANGAFKGVWLAAGENEVEFKFGSLFQYFLKLGEVILFLLMLTLCIVEWRRESL